MVSIILLLYQHKYLTCFQLLETSKVFVWYWFDQKIKLTCETKCGNSLGLCLGVMFASLWFEKTSFQITPRIPAVLCGLKWWSACLHDWLCNYYGFDLSTNILKTSLTFCC